MAEYSKKYSKEKNAMTVPVKWIYSALSVHEEYFYRMIVCLLVMSFAIVAGLDWRL